MKDYRATITTSDIILLMGKSTRSAQRLMSKMRAFYYKQRNQYITFSEFADYNGIPKEEIDKYFEKLR